MYDKIASYYDTLYDGKGYESECDFAIQAFEQEGVEVHSLLDVGCGTGRHAAAFTQRGYQVVGIDQSAGMIEKARGKHPSLDFAIQDARTLRLDKTFDAAISMFGTMTYFTDLEEFRQVLQSLHRHLKLGGLFLFDGWNEEAVCRAKTPNGQLKAHTQKLLKYTEMVPRSPYIADQQLTIIDIERQKVIDYKTPLLLFTKEMISNLLKESGFVLRGYYKAFAMDQQPTLDDWKVSVIATRE